MVKPKENPSEQEEKNEIWSDPRFSHLVSDPRFKNLPKSERKVKIDKRFESMFNDKKFKVKYTVDKYGRKINKTSSEDLKKYYDIGSSDDEEEEAKEKQKEEKQIVKDDDEPEVDENDVLQSDGEEVPATLKERLLDPSVDYARGEGRLISDSSSDDESSEDEDEELFIEHVWGELDRDAETTEESSKRLAVCNMDWDRIRASDIMVVCSSFLPPGGSILSVSIYPSEFGKQRMAEEEKYGPPELVKKNNDEENSDSDEELVKEQDSDAEEGDEYHMEKLRQYQLNRLKYYYAVIVCDSVETADKIYQECDGIEYESSATKVDLRFIPDDTSFDDDEPRDVCTTLPEVGQYKPRNFTTTALQQATVDLTWDETSLERREVGDKLLSGKMNEVSDADLRKFVAYSSEEEEEDEGEDDGEEEDNKARNKNEKKKKEQADEVEEDSSNKTKPAPAEGKKKKKEDPISKYKALLQEITEKEEKAKKNKFEMEYSWDVAAEEKSAEKPEEKSKPALTPIEKVLQKRSEKNKRRKEERKKKKKQANGSDDDDGAIDSDQSDDYPDGIDMNDPYFAEEFANGDFEAPKSKKKDKNKKKSKKTESDNEEEEQKAKELQLLMDDDEEDDKQHFSLEKIIKTENETKSKKKRKKQLKKSKGEINSAKKEVDDNFEVNVEDDRFKAIFSSHHFNIDPTDSHFKKTKGMEQIIHEKLKRRHGDNKKNIVVEDEMESKRPKKLIENSMLVKSLKRKLQQQSNGRK